MADPRPPRRGNWEAPFIPRAWRPRPMQSEQENSDSAGSQSDRRNGVYPGRVFYPSSRANRELSLSPPRVGTCMETFNNNNSELLEEAGAVTKPKPKLMRPLVNAEIYMDSSDDSEDELLEEARAAVTRDLFKELPNGAENGDSKNGSPKNAAKGEPNLSCLRKTELNWRFPSPEASKRPHNHNASRQNRHARTPYNNALQAGSSLSHTATSGALSEEWANAPEFYPQYLNANGATAQEGSQENNSSAGAGNAYSAAPEPPRGDPCPICGLYCTAPKDKFKKKTHRRASQQHDKGFESTTAAVERSRDKTCGICFEAVMEKPIGERRFGILTMCNHCFCLECIRKWRQARNFENKVVKSCPECRITSDFVCPSIYWVDTKEEKDMLIEKYKNALSEKHCKYFRQGRGVCPFGNKCFYLHALPDGTKTDVGPPPRRRRSNYRQSEDIDLADMLQQIILWDIHDENEHRWLYSFADDIEELVSFFSDSDESEWSDYDLF